MQPTVWSRLIRFIASEDGKEYYGQPIDPNQDVGHAYSTRTPILAHPLHGTPFSPTATLTTTTTRTVHHLLTPLPASTIGTIRALGANFLPPAPQPSRQAALANRPALPIVFYKPLTALSAPGQTVTIPTCASDESDYEAELVVILGSDCRNVSPSQALQYVLGYTLSNDLTARKRMAAASQWGLAKSFDGWLPLGPCIVSASHRNGILNPDAVQLRTELNGAEMQNGTTDDMLWKVAETVSQLSIGTTLQAGSVISMGTPPGEGFKRNPPVFLKDGDICKVWGGNGLGSLINPLQAELSGATLRSKL